MSPRLPPKKHRPWLPKPSKPQSGRTEKTDFYVSVAWRKLRNAYIQEHPLCVLCEKEGLVRAAYYVDHITPIRQGGEALDESNLQSLCKPCHDKKSGQERHSNK